MTDQTLQLLLSRLDNLTVEFHALREAVRKAVRLSDDDPEMALTRSRKILEYLVVDVYKIRYQEDPGNRSLENLLQRLVKDGHLPRKLGAYASNIRELGNVGTHVHGEDLTKEDVRRSFENLSEIMEWYFERVRPDAFMKVEDLAREEEEQALLRVEEETHRREKELAEELAREEEKARRLAEEVARRREEELERTRQEAEALKRKQQESEAESARKKAVADAARNAIAEQKAAPLPPKPTPPAILSDYLNKLAGVNSDDDPEMALTRARQVLDYVVRDVFQLRYQEDSGTRPLELLLLRLVKDGHLPRRLGAYASYIRELGNVGTHVYGETLSSEDVRRSFENLREILEWYFERVRPEAFGKAEDPAREEESQSRLRVEEEARRRDEATAREEEKARGLKEESRASDENELVAGKSEWKWISDALDGARRRHEELERKWLEAEKAKRMVEVEKAGIEENQRETEEIEHRPAAGSVPTNMTNGIGMEFVWIPPGSFMMGSENGGSYEKPVHRVTISEGFYMGKYEVTQAQWHQIMGNNLWQRIIYPSTFKGDNLPRERVMWEDAVAFIAKLNKQNDGLTYRLPTEAEWEYAARAGTTGDYAGDLDAMAWYKENSDDKTHPVGRKQPNTFGLFDMHGNVLEWCQDLHHYSYDGAPADGSAWLSGAEPTRVLRGGSWFHRASACRSSARQHRPPGNHYSFIGLRVVAVART